MRTHPESGRKSLYVNAAFTVRIRGMSGEESARLLGYLYSRAAIPEVAVPVAMDRERHRALGQPFLAALRRVGLLPRRAPHGARHDLRRQAGVIRRARALAAAAIALSLPVASAAAAPRPNVVLILADDLGSGDLSSYGAQDIATPNIDRLAREGVRFTDFYSAANTCSPRARRSSPAATRRARGQRGALHDTPEGLPLAEVTLAELLRDAGYDTAMVGKWHLGNTDEFMPLAHGFDEFFGVPHSNDQKNFFSTTGTGASRRRSISRR